MNQLKLQGNKMATGISVVNVNNITISNGKINDMNVGLYVFQSNNVVVKEITFDTCNIAIYQRFSYLQIL